MVAYDGSQISFEYLGEESQQKEIKLAWDGWQYTEGGEIVYDTISLWKKNWTWKKLLQNFQKWGETYVFGCVESRVGKGAMKEKGGENPWKWGNTW